MAARKIGLAAQVESIVSEAADSVRTLVRESLKREIGALLGGVAEDVPQRKKPGPKPGAKRGRKPGRPAKAAGKGAKKKGKPGPKPKGAKAGGTRAARGSLVDAVAALGKFVAEQGEVAPADARKALKLRPAQIQAVARKAAEEGLIKVEGAGRGTRYKKG